MKPKYKYILPDGFRTNRSCRAHGHLTWLKYREAQKRSGGGAPTPPQKLLGVPTLPLLVSGGRRFYGERYLLQQRTYPNAEEANDALSQKFAQDNASAVSTVFF
jgi:hypothetical protein